MNTCPANLICVNTKDACALLGNMPLRTFRRLVGRGQIKKIMNNRYSVDQIRHWVNSQAGIKTNT